MSAVFIVALLVMPLSRNQVFADDAATTTSATTTDTTVTTGTTSTDQTNTQNQTPPESTTTPSTDQTTSLLTSQDSTTTPTSTSTSTDPTASSTSIATGDATSLSQTQNTVNTNDTSIGTSTATSTNPDSNPILGDTASSTASSTPVTTDTSDTSTTTATTTASVANGNSAGVGNDSTTTAQTGSNQASSDATTTIDTGNATAVADVTNIVNTNTTDSSGGVAVANQTDPESSVDVRGASPDLTGTSTATSTCSGSCPNLVSVSNTNTASVQNNVSVSANTGGNNATGTDSLIITGNAAAVANLVNVVNTNILNTNFLIFILNELGDWHGNLILPSTDYFARFLSSSASSTENGSSNPSGVTIVTNDNNASVGNNSNVSADTGGNSATGADSAIQTGNAVAKSNTLNIVNTNLTNTNSFTVLFNVLGGWTGSIYNLPGGITAIPFQNGFYLTNSGQNLSTLESELSPTNLSNNNTANVDNNVSVSANTGANDATGTSVTVATGNAYAVGNTVNIINTNIVGSNIYTGIVNVFGNWSGSLSFGEPDLSLSVTSDNTATITYGSGATLPDHFYVTNSGDADAHNVTITASLDNPVLGFTDGANNSGGYSWNIGTVPAHSSIDITKTTTFSAKPSETQEIVHGLATVSSDEPDANNGNNGTTFNISISAPTPEQAPYIVVVPYLLIDKHASVTSTTASSSVTYTIHINNLTNQATNAELYDRLEDPQGHVMEEQTWNLGNIKARDEVIVTYDAVFSASTTPGVYTNYAQVVSDTGSSLIASSSVEILQSGGSVTTATTTPDTTIPPIVINSNTIKSINLPEVKGASISVDPFADLVIAPTSCVMPHISDLSQQKSTTDVFSWLSQIISMIIPHGKGSLVYAASLFLVSRRRNSNESFGIF